MSINRVVVSGNLTRDPEIRAAQSGTNVLTFGIAVNDRRRNPQTQEWEDYANFVDCVMFGNRADYMSRTLHKGIKVVVEGKLRYSSWERDGQRRSKLEVVVDDIDFISPRQQQGGYGAPQTGGYASQQPQPQPQVYGQQPAYSAPAPMDQAPQQMGAPRMQQPAAPAYAAPMQAPARPAPVQPQAQPQPQPMPAAPATPAPTTSGPAVTTAPETDVYDEDIPF